MGPKSPLIEAAELAAAAFALMKSWDDEMSATAAEAMAVFFLAEATEHLECTREMAAEIRAEADKERAAAEAFRDSQPVGGR